MSDVARNPVPNRSTFVRRLLWSPAELKKVYPLIAGCGLMLILPIRERIGNAREAAGGSFDSPLLEVLESSRVMAPAVMDDGIRVMLPFVAVLWAVIAWKDLPFGKRDYTWSLPVDRPSHDLWRVAAGAVHLLVAMLVVAVLAGAFSMLEGVPLLPQGSWPFWLSFFGLPLALYLVASIASVASRSPGVWIIGAIMASPLVGIVGANTDTPALDRVFSIAVIGEESGSDSMALLPTLAHGRTSGTVAWLKAFTDAHPGGEVRLSDRSGTRVLATPLELKGWTSHLTWLLACVLWMIPILGGLWLAARRRI